MRVARPSIVSGWRDVTCPLPPDQLSAMTFASAQIRNRTTTTLLRLLLRHPSSSPLSPLDPLSPLHAHRSVRSRSTQATRQLQQQPLRVLNFSTSPNRYSTGYSSNRSTMSTADVFEASAAGDLQAIKTLGRIHLEAKNDRGWTPVSVLRNLLHFF